jgi:hypothetical protein
MGFGLVQVAHVSYNSNYKSTQVLSQPLWSHSNSKWLEIGCESTWIIGILKNMCNLHKSQPHAWNQKPHAKASKTLG